MVAVAQMRVRATNIMRQDMETRRKQKCARKESQINGYYNFRDRCQSINQSMSLFSPTTITYLHRNIT